MTDIASLISSLPTETERDLLIVLSSHGSFEHILSERTTKDTPRIGQRDDGTTHTLLHFLEF